MKAWSSDKIVGMLGGALQQRKYLRSRHLLTCWDDQSDSSNDQHKKGQNCFFLKGSKVKKFHNPDVFFHKCFWPNGWHFFCWKVISLWLWGRWATGEAAAKLVTPDRSRQPPRRSTFLVSKNLKKKKLILTRFLTRLTRIRQTIQSVSNQTAFGNLQDDQHFLSRKMYKRKTSFQNITR